jgi:hypothetical protein
MHLKGADPIITMWNEVDDVAVVDDDDDLMV